MRKNEKPGEAVDWSLTTWDGSRREALRRWAQLPLERIIAALEEMQELSDMLSKSRIAGGAVAPPAAENAVHEQRSDYNAKTGTQPASAQNATPTGLDGSRQPSKKGGKET